MMSDPVSLCADDIEPRTLVIVDDGRYWVPVFALDMACALLYPEVSPLVYDAAVLIARRRIEWLKRTRERADTLLDELRANGDA